MLGRLITVVGWAFQSNHMLHETHFHPNLPSENCSAQISHAHQIVDRAGEGKQPVHFAHSTMSHLPHQGDRLQLAEAFFNALPLSLTDRVTLVSRSAAINRT